ncbi:peptidase C11, clostripain [sediment metagenome]|uniref:Peptidase C11, clostripain n=1 Tax=sediment metagenome TaxID=749907 RepID=D9PGM2_9ZZZZ
MYQAALALLLALNFIPSAASAAAGHKLDPGEWFQVGKVICGLVKGHWVPGRFTRSNRFLSDLEKRKILRRKAIQASGAKRKKLLKQAGTWKKRNKQERSACQAPPTPTPTPPPSTGRKWTVMVYLAADNNLAYQGLLDLDEMEAGGGSNQNVQIVVQAEYNPDELEQCQITSPQAFNRPNYNTFRYAVVSGSQRLGPDGSASDLGNRDMTSPAELKEFVTWAKQAYPAQHYALVLWNHGGGFTGLLQDQTSAGGNRMTLSELKSGLTGVGKIDLLDFDMCLMGGYETLTVINGLADNVVFSQETVPGEGNPYDTIVAGLRANPAISPADLARLFVQKFYDSYAQDARNSITKSAFALSNFSQFEAALNNLAEGYLANMGSIKSLLKSSAANAQSYTLPQFKDLYNLNATLSPSLGSLTPVIQPLLAQVNSSLEAVTLRLSNKYHSGSDYECSNVDRSHGLSVTLPSLSGDDAFSDTGSRSFSFYETNLSGKAWTRFLKDYLQGGQVSDALDLGTARPEWYLIWSEQAAQYDVDLDMVILEPDGNVYIPYLGSVSPNGTLTPDSYDTGLSFEGYVFNRYVLAGTYYLLALLYSDPSGYMPYYDVLYRSSAAAEFSSIFAPDYPFLSTEVSWEADPDFSLEKVLQNSYSDFQFAAYWCMGSQCPANVSGSSRSLKGRATTPELGAPREDAPTLTKGQMQKVESLLRDRKIAGDPRLREMIEQVSPRTARALGPRDLGTSYFWKRMGR